MEIYTVKTHIFLPFLSCIVEVTEPGDVTSLFILVPHDCSGYFIQRKYRNKKPITQSSYLLLSLSQSKFLGDINSFVVNKKCLSSDN